MVLLSNTHTLLFSHRPDLTHTKVIGNIVCNSNYRLPRYLIWLNVPAGAREVRAINAFTSAGPVATVKTSDTQAERQSPDHHQKSNRHEFKRPPPPKKRKFKRGTHALPGEKTGARGGATIDATLLLCCIFLLQYRLHCCNSCLICIRYILLTSNVHVCLACEIGFFFLAQMRPSRSFQAAKS